MRSLNKTTGIVQNIDINGLDVTKDGGEVSFTFRRSLLDDLASDDVFSEVDVEALGLRVLLKDCIGPDYPGLSFGGEIVNITAPFAPLVCRPGKHGHFTASPLPRVDGLKENFDALS